MRVAHQSITTRSPQAPTKKAVTLCKMEPWVTMDVSNTLHTHGIYLTRAFIEEDMGGDMNGASPDEGAVGEADMQQQMLEEQMYHQQQMQQQHYMQM